MIHEQPARLQQWVVLHTDITDALCADPTLGVERVIHTPCSTVLLCNQSRAFKIRKPVDLGYLDFTTLESRRRFGLEEIRLNAALAPGVYQRLAPIVRREDGRIELLADDASVRNRAEVVEYAVVMRRLKDQNMLAARLEAGAVRAEELAAIAQMLSVFHARADVGAVLPADFPRGEMLTNLDQLESPALTCGACEPGLLGVLRTRLTAELERLSAVLRARMTDGRVRELHGDVHAGNICLPDSAKSGGVPIIFDRIEFEPRFRTCDPAAEVATLSMDLIRRGHGGAGRAFVDAYAAASGDAEVRRLQPVYRSHYAAVRAKVAAMRGVQADASDQERAACAKDAAGYLALALGVLQRPSLVITCGLPGSGKSYLAGLLHRAMDADWHRSDVIRKELAGLEATARAADDAAAGAMYSRDSSRRTYEELRGRCEASLRAGVSAIADANFRDRASRGVMMEMARRLGVPAVIVHASADETETRRRLTARAAAGSDASDADWGVYLKLREQFEVPRGEEGCVVEATDADAAERVVQRVVMAMACEGARRQG